MVGYAIARLRDLAFGPEIATYVARIDATLEPFGGRFLVHGDGLETVEGSWTGDLVVIEFPSVERARAWYRSAAYQAILPLRTRHARSDVVLAEGVAPGHRAVDILDRIAMA